ncbi:hypothetical protein [Domibacillus sp.]|uniref:hypothetical protein n=1 Tax=Domibacillus sp. TaxID=1969783 RepID=UPI002811505C|nr:hypothetical protein [Domibacillus sp.]
MIFPHVLLILVLIMAASVSAADAAVTKWKTADHLTNYYELRVAELMALRRVLTQSEPVSFETKTNLGITSAAVKEIAEQNWQIRITTTHTDGFFRATYVYDPRLESFLSRVEYH